MLILFLATLHYKRQKAPDSVKLDRIPTVYVHFDNSFPQVDGFVDYCSKKYLLDVMRLPSPMKSALTKYLDMTKNGIKCILIGIRRTDPYGDQLKYYERTDHGWPDFMRVHPVLEWHYVEIWDVSI